MNFLADALKEKSDTTVYCEKDHFAKSKWPRISFTHLNASLTSSV